LAESAKEFGVLSRKTSHISSLIRRTLVFDTSGKSGGGTKLGSAILKKREEKERREKEMKSNIT